MWEPASGMTQTDQKTGGVVPSLGLVTWSGRGHWAGKAQPSVENTVQARHVLSRLCNVQASRSPLQAGPGLALGPGASQPDCAL